MDIVRSYFLYFVILKAQNAGSLFIAAAGNGGSDHVGDDNDTSSHYPSNYELDNIIAVAATDQNDELTSFSNYGKTSVDLAAPGSSIYSTIHNGAYGYKSGTSMATPHVTGAAALVWAACPSLTAQQVKERILSSVDPISDLKDKMVTGGRLNVFRAIQGCATPPPPPPMKTLYRLYLGIGGDGWSNHMDSGSMNESGFSCQRRLGQLLETQVPGTKPLYRIFRHHDASGRDIKDDHMATDTLSEVISGSTNEGIMGYVYNTQVPGTIPLYRKYRQYWYTIWGGENVLHTDHITTTDRYEGDSQGWQYERVLGYIMGPASSSCP